MRIMELRHPLIPYINVYAQIYFNTGIDVHNRYKYILYNFLYAMFLVHTLCTKAHIYMYSIMFAYWKVFLVYFPKS